MAGGFVQILGGDSPSESLGGDAFGYHWLDGTRLAVYLLDVCGHGVGPALLGVSAMNVLRSGAVPGRDMGDPGAVIEGLNDLFPMERHNDLFFTIWYGVLDTAAGTLRWSGGARPPALLLRPGAKPERLMSQGLMVGAAMGVPYDSEQVRIEPGSRLLLSSDGIFELARPDGSMASLEEFIATVPHAPQGPDRLDAMLAHARAEQRRDSFADDVSLLEVRLEP